MFTVDVKQQCNLSGCHVAKHYGAVLVNVVSFISVEDINCFNARKDTKTNIIMIYRISHNLGYFNEVCKTWLKFHIDGRSHESLCPKCFELTYRKGSEFSMWSNSSVFKFILPSNSKMCTLCFTLYYLSPKLMTKHFS